MEIDKKKCVGCGNCHAVCTMGVIYLDEDGKSVVNQDECVECFTCYRVCRSEGYTPWFVRAIRKVLSLFRFGISGGGRCLPDRSVNASGVGMAEKHPGRLQRPEHRAPGYRRPRKGNRRDQEQ